MAVTPSYYGVAGDVAAMADVCHQHDVPLIVDGASGIHFPFHPDLPPRAMQSGADMEIGSVHKNGSGLAPSSILSIKEDRVTVDEAKARVDLLEAASPAVPIFASIDAWRRSVALADNRCWTERSLSPGAPGTNSTRSTGSPSSAKRCSAVRAPTPSTRPS